MAATPRPPRQFLNVGVGALVAIATLLLVTATWAGADFKIRMRVTEVKSKDNFFAGYVTHISKAGRPAVILGGHAYTVRAPKKKIFTEDENGKLGRIDIDGIRVDKWVRVTGRLRSDGSLEAKTVIVQ